MTKHALRRPTHRRHSSLIVCAIAAALASRPGVAQLPFEIVQRGQVEPSVVQAVAQATLHSLASLARLGVVLDGPPKAYICATKADYAAVLVEFGLFDRPTAERRSNFYSGQSALGAFALNLEHMRSYTARPDLQVWWTVPHEIFHLYQRQSRADRIGTPFAFWEGPADLHKLKVLDEQRIINFRSYVQATQLPRSLRARRNLPAFSIRRIGISYTTSQELSDHYAIATALGLYLHENGGWPSIIALYAPGDTPFAARFEAIYGTTLETFEQEFFNWLERQ
jgi:hypothetical protein